MKYRERTSRKWGRTCGIYKRKKDEDGYQWALSGYQDWLDTLTVAEGCDEWFADEYANQFEESWKIS